MSASARLAAASAVAASLILSALPAAAADLYEPPRYGSPYEEQRYGDIYRDGPARYDRYAAPHEFEPAYPPYVVNGEEDYDEAPYAPYRRHARNEDDCPPRHVIRKRLRADGWGEFRDVEARDGIVLVQARRDSGRLFDLTIDRCSGEILEARPVDGGRDYAYRSRRHWDHSY